MSVEQAGCRVQFVTGGGGAGVTTVAAATARAAARAGVRTALVTTAQEAARAPVKLAGASLDSLEVIPVDHVAEFQTRMVAWQRAGQGAFDHLGALPLDEDELTELPGAQAYALLRALRATVDLGTHELVVVDLPQAGDAVRLLALPGQLARYLTRLVPTERQAARALRPVLAQLAGVPMPAQWLYEVSGRWREELEAMARLVQGPSTSAVLVVEPTARATDTVASARAGLALWGLPVETVCANRVLPGGHTEGWLAAAAQAQRVVLGELRDAHDARPVTELPHLGREVSRATDLDGLAAPPAQTPQDRPRPRVEDRLSEDRELLWKLPLPGALKEDLGLVRRGDEVLVTVGPYRRALSLSAALRRCTVVGARFAEGELAVRFAPDPALWPKGG